MSIIQPHFQTVEEIYRLLWTAVRHKRPIEATYQRRLRLFCPIDWAGMQTDTCAQSATRMAARAKTDFSRLDPCQLALCSARETQ